MEKSILSGIIVIMVVGAIAGVFIFNNMNPKTSEVSNPVITDNQTGNSSTNINESKLQSPSTLFALCSYSLFNSQSIPGPSPGPVDPMAHFLSVFDVYVNEIFPQSGVPGSAILIVKDGNVVYQKCLGVKDIASGAPVDENTLFELGSITKAFTATLIAQLVDNGIMNWDDPITKYYNNTDEFQLYNDYVTSNITIRDCLCHRSGLPHASGDQGWEMFNDSYSRILYNLRYIENDAPFRDHHQYQNTLYALAGYCAARATNTTWNELLEENLLKPLGMKTATTTYSDYLKSSDHVNSYLRFNGTLTPYHVASLDEIGPAGSMACSISEMANWLKFQLADTGIYNCIQIVSKKELDETHTGQTPDPEIPGVDYGLGWYVVKSSTLGPNISHGGDTVSNKNTVQIFPSEGIDIVIFTNEGHYGTAFLTSVISKFQYLLISNENTDKWPAQKNATDISTKPLPASDPYTPPLPLSIYVGVYSNAFYGNINVTTDNNTLTCYYGNNMHPFNLTHYNASYFIDYTNGGYGLNFIDIHDGSAHQIEANYMQNYSTVPATNYSVFNRTNST